MALFEICRPDKAGKCTTQRLHRASRQPIVPVWRPEAVHSVAVRIAGLTKHFGSGEQRVEACGASTGTSTPDR